MTSPFPRKPAQTASDIFHFDHANLGSQFPKAITCEREKMRAFKLLALAVCTTEAFTTPRIASTKKHTFADPLNFAPKDVEAAATDFSLASTMAPIDESRMSRASTWEKFANWVTSTDNRLYIGWFGKYHCSLMACIAV